jgi:ubiquitin-conjugating enzyme E2 variant
LVALAGALTADFGSGVIHWLADTWGSETMPVLGRRFLHPFRVHHVNPDDFLRREFADTNGDVSMILTPCLAAALAIPLDRGWGHALAVFVVAFCVVGLPTNQVHQWAHRPQPPRWVRRLQDRGILLSREEHRRHHVAPYVENYCIATGWCNAVLRRLRFFRRMELLVTRLTGLRPREDDAAFQDQLEPWLLAPIGRKRAP